MSEISPRTVKEMSPEERPQEKALRLGVEALTLPELWALVLRVGQPGVNITDLTSSMMAQNNGHLKELERRSRKELMQIPGIGEVKALQIEAVLEIMRRYNREKIGERPRIRCAADIFNFIQDDMRHLDHETIWIIFLAHNNGIIEKKKFSQGGSTATVFDLKKILKESLLTPGCHSLIMCHNHPSGSLRPSPADDGITRSLKEGCEFLGLKLLDHLIVTNEGFYSYADSGRL